jgi:Family of unknown function (DUF5677)
MRPENLSEQFAALEETVKELRGDVRHFLRMFDYLLHALMNLDKDPRPAEPARPISTAMARVLVPMIQATGVSCSSLLALSEPPYLQTRDCYSVARSIIESLVNLVYTLARGDNEAERAYRHAYQKVARETSQTRRIADWTFSLQIHGLDKSKFPKELKDAIKEFTSPRGWEENWPGPSIDRRLDKIGKKFPKEVLVPLFAARLLNYTTASEVVHGSLFGAVYVLGLASLGAPPKSVDGLKVHTLGLLEYILVSVVMAMWSFFLAIDDTYDTPALREMADRRARGFVKDLAKRSKGNSPMEASFRQGTG